MATGEVRAGKDTYPNPDVAHYNSMSLRLFSKALDQRPEGQVLDVGPVCGENICFFAQQVKRLYVCDMFLRLHLARREGLSSGRVWRHIDYPVQSFDGILLWELIDHLDDRDAGRLVELSYNMVKPGGMVVVFAFGEQATPPVVNSFVVGDGFRFYLRPQFHLDLPMHSRHNRDVLALLAPFTPLKTLIHSNGLREFLFQRD